MDLDALSGTIAGKHAGEGVTVVTAACDRISIENPLKEICDLEYSGQVTYASGKSVRQKCQKVLLISLNLGRSSMEVTCKVAKAPAEGQTSKPEDVLLTCMFTMVAIDSETRKYVILELVA